MFVGDLIAQDWCIDSGLLILLFCKEFPFWGVFPSFPRDFRGLSGKKDPCFFIGFLCFATKSKEKKIGVGLSAPWMPL